VPVDVDEIDGKSDQGWVLVLDLDLGSRRGGGSGGGGSGGGDDDDDDDGRKGYALPRTGYQ
jgi:hypothetical protein